LELFDTLHQLSLTRQLVAIEQAGDFISAETLSAKVI